MRILDIFSGGGGSSFGARAAGAEIVCGIDMSSIATQTFSHNFPNAITKTSKLEDIDPFQLRDEIGDIDTLLASPECTNHTCAKGAGPRSEDSKATAMQVIRFAKAFNPQWIIMENVIHMRPWSRYNEMKQQLQNLDYSITELVLDSSYFSVPQSRRRLFLICSKSGSFEYEQPKRKTKKTVRTILDKPGTWKTSNLFTPKRAKPTLERAQRGFDALGENTPFLLVYYGSDGSGGWQPIDRPLRTITTVDRFALVEPSDKGHQMRMLQVPELTRAMGFTSKYKLPFGTRRQKIHILGNGVCPPVMQSLIGAISTQTSNEAESFQDGMTSFLYPESSDQAVGL